MKQGARPSRQGIRWAVALAAAGFCAAGAQAAAPAAPEPRAAASFTARDGALAPAPVLEAVDVAAAAAAQLPVPTQPHPAREWWIWGALCFALLLLFGMVWSLFASLRKDRARG